MWIIVTLQAIREFLMQTIVMWVVVTINTGLRTAMITLVTLDTVQRAMSRFTRGQSVNLVTVAGRTVISWQWSVKSNCGWGMRRAVTTQASSVIHTRTVWFVTFSTLHRLTMLWMTTVAILLCMQAWSCGKSFLHIRVTALTGRFDIFRLRQITIKGVVGQVTLLTVSNRIVRIIFRLVAAGTARDHIITKRWVSTVTADTWLLAMLATLFGQKTSGIGMTRRTNRTGLSRSGLDHMWQVRWVTFQAITVSHLRDVWFVAIEALL